MIPLWLRRFWRWLIGAAPNADAATLSEIGAARDEDMTEITLMMGAAPRSFRIVPNKGDVTVENVSVAIAPGWGGPHATLSPYAAEPDNPLAFTLTPTLATDGNPDTLSYSFDSATEPGAVQTVSGSVPITVLPENATEAEVVEIV